MAFELTSSAFIEGQPIPRKYTDDGDDVSPPLEWRGAPDGTKSFALIIEDPDAPRGMFRHWAIYNIDAKTDHLTEGHGNRELLARGSTTSASAATTARPRRRATARITIISGSLPSMLPTSARPRTPGSMRSGASPGTIPSMLRS